MLADFGVSQSELGTDDPKVKEMERELAERRAKEEALAEELQVSRVIALVCAQCIVFHRRCVPSWSSMSKVNI